MKLSKVYASLCPPAKFYLIISAVSFILMLIQNIGRKGEFALGGFKCPHNSPGLILLFNALYIGLWTWMLNVICKINPKISWLIVLLPFILLFIGFGMLMLRGGK